MTIAIGAYFEDRASDSPADHPGMYYPVTNRGVVVCADTKIVAADGVTTYGTKLIFTGNTTGGEQIVIANAAEDGNAANSLAEEILASIYKSTDHDSFITPAEYQKNIPNAVKKVMTDWHKSYIQTVPPSIQFILGFAADFHLGLYFCEPPSTILYQSNRRPITIGRGGRAIDAMLDSVFPSVCGAKETLSRLAYLMYRAKRDQAGDCGGDTDAVIVKSLGYLPIPISSQEMAIAEAFGPDIDGNIRDCIDGFMDRNTGIPSKLSWASLLNINQKYSHRNPKK